MPCTLPLVVVSGVFMSPCASTQIRPERLRRGAADPGGAGRDRAGRQAVIAAEHQRQRAGVERLQRRRRSSCRHTLAISPMYFFRSSAGRCVSGIGAGRSPLSTTCVPSARDALAEAGDAKRRRPHVDAAAAAAEIERHADDVDRLQRRIPNADRTHEAIGALDLESGVVIGSCTTPTCLRPTATRSS